MEAEVTPARVNITALDDSVRDEGFETIVIQGRAAGYAVRSIAVNLGDNDNSPNLIILKVDADATINGCQPSLGEGVSGQSVTVFASYADTNLRLRGSDAVNHHVGGGGRGRSPSRIQRLHPPFPTSPSPSPEVRHLLPELSL